MFQHEFKTDISNKLSKLNKIPYINKGGCAIVAYALQAYITKAYPTKESEIIFLFTPSDRKGLRNTINNKVDSCEHAVLKIDNTYYDATGIYTRDELHSNWNIGGTVIIDSNLTQDCINKAEWNPCFNRAKHVPRIGHVLKAKQLLTDTIKTDSRY